MQQTFKLATQLAGGVRALMLDLHKWTDSSGISRVMLCHGSSDSFCTGAVGSNYVEPRVSLAAGLRPVKEFLEKHPNEIVTIFLESYIGDAGLVRQAFVDAGLQGYLFDPANDPAWTDRKAWPTLEWMIANGKRLLVTSSNAADSAAGAVGIAPHYEVAVENTYDLGKTGSDDACTARSASYALGSVHDRQKLFVMNNFRSLPNLIAASEDNRPDRIVARVKKKCMPEAKRPPNYVAVDFYQHPNCGAANAVIEINSLWESYR